MNREQFEHEVAEGKDRMARFDAERQLIARADTIMDAYIAAMVRAESTLAADVVALMEAK